MLNDAVVLEYFKEHATGRLKAAKYFEINI